MFENAKLTLPSTGFYLLLGENGSGKSTLFEILANDDHSYEGKYFFNDKLVTKNDTDFHFNHVSIVYQEPYLISGLTIIENLMFPFDSKDRKYAESILKKVNLESLKDENIDTLSSGEKQRLMIAIAIFENKEILLFDEAISNLDEQNAKDIIDLAIELSKDRLVIFSSHDSLKELGYTNLNVISIENNELILSNNYVNNKESDNTNAVTSSLKGVSFWNIVKLILKNNYKVFCFFGFLVSLVISLTSLGSNFCLGQANILDLSAQQIFDYYDVYNFNLVSNKESDFYFESPKDLSKITTTYTFKITSNNILFLDDEYYYPDNVVFSPNSNDEYNLIEGKYPENENELVISNLTYQKALKEGLQVYDKESGDLLTIYPKSIEDINKYIPYKIVGVYENNKMNWDFYNYSHELCLSFKTTCYFTAPNLFFDNLAYNLDNLDITDIRGYSYSLIKSDNSFNYEEISTIAKPITYALASTSFVLLIALFNITYIKERDKINYLRLLGTRRQVFFKTFLITTLLFSIISIVLSIIFIPIGITIFNNIVDDFYPFTTGYHFERFSFISIVPIILSILVSLIFLVIRFRKLFSKEIVNLYQEQKENS